MTNNKSALLALGVVVALSVALGGCSPAPAVSLAQRSPEEVVEAFYRWHTGYPGNALADGAYRSSEYLTEDFVKKVDEIIASFDKGGYDPFLCAQDVPESFTVGEAVVSGDTATLVVHTSFEGHGFAVALQRVDGLWRVSDVLCEGT